MSDRDGDDNSPPTTATATSGPHRFTSESARAASVKAAEKRKEQAEARRLSRSSVVAGDLQDGQTGVLVPIDHVSVIQALNRASKGGDVQAAGTLLRWVQAFPHVDTDVALDKQPRHIRNRLLRLMLEEVRRQEGQEGEADHDESASTAPSASPDQDREATPQSEGVPLSLSAGGVPAPTHTGNPAPEAT